MSNTPDVIGDKLIFVCSQSGVSATNPLVAFYNIHGRKTEALFFYFVPNSTQDLETYNIKYDIGNNNDINICSAMSLLVFSVKASNLNFFI
jgi:hypothetical protein